MHQVWQPTTDRSKSCRSPVGPARRPAPPTQGLSLSQSELGRPPGMTACVQHTRDGPQFRRHRSPPPPRPGGIPPAPSSGAHGRLGGPGATGAHAQLRMTAEPSCRTRHTLVSAATAPPAGPEAVQRPRTAAAANINLPALAPRPHRHAPPAPAGAVPCGPRNQYWQPRTAARSRDTARRRTAAVPRRHPAESASSTATLASYGGIGTNGCQACVSTTPVPPACAYLRLCGSPARCPPPGYNMRGRDHGL